MHHTIFENGLKSLAVIRATLETLTLFAADDPIREEILPLISEARADFLHQMESVHNRILANPQSLALNYETFRVNAIKMMTDGYSGRNLNRMLKVSVFEEDKSSLYYVKAAGLIELETVRTMPAYLFTALLFNAVWQDAANEEYYIDQQTFDAEIYLKYLILLFLHYSVSDQQFYGLHDTYEN